MTRISNDKVLEQGYAAAMKMVDEHIYNQIALLAERLMEVVEGQKEYKNLTGNTVTSYMVGVYHDRILTEIVQIQGKKPPIRIKMRKGEIFTGKDYDGDFRKRWGPTEVDTDGGYGEQFAMRFLSSYRPKRKGYSLVVCTGTEYSEFLENVRNLNVLSNNFDLARGTFLKSFKRMK